MGTNLITAVLTSCGRFDLLRLTLRSFFDFNTYPISKMIVVEDGGEVPAAIRQEFLDQSIEWISTGQRVGQIAAIDYAYSRVSTPYIFHLEDDWQFYSTGFLEQSLKVLQSNPKCVQVWIRAQNDTQRHPIESHQYCSQGVKWRRMSFGYQCKGIWHGFSFNPGLRRLSDYVAIGGYGVNARFNLSAPGEAESKIGIIYRNRDYFAAILAGNDGKGYVKHIGFTRHIGTDARREK